MKQHACIISDTPLETISERSIANFQFEQLGNLKMKFKRLILMLTVAAILASCSGLKSDPKVGLSPNTHKVAGLDVRNFTNAPLMAEVKVFLPITQREAMSIVSDFKNYPAWVSPAPENVTVDNSGTKNGEFGVGSKVSYKKGETDLIDFYDGSLAMIARPLWGLGDFDGHRGVVLVTKSSNGSIMHMRRYFRTKGVKGWFMSQMMPIFMKNSAENLADLYKGKVL